MRNKTNLIVSSFIGTIVLFSCSGEVKQNKKTTDAKPSIEIVEPVKEIDPMSNKGIGQISSVELTEIDQTMVEAGEKLFSEKCSACHKVDKKYIGPGMAGILDRRTPEWVMNMIMNPEQMVAEDPIAQKLLEEYLSPMANQSLTEEETRTILEYFRTI